MHRATATSTLALLLAASFVLGVTGLVAAGPPRLPSSFYGEIGVTGYTCTTGTLLRVYHDVNGDGVPDAGEPLVASTSVAYQDGLGKWTYTVDVPQNPCDEGDALIFVLSQPPTAHPDSAALDEDTSRTIDVLANDSDGTGVVATGAVWHEGTNVSMDLNSIALRGLSVGIVGQPAHGLAELSGSRIVYTPDQDYCGEDAFTYSVNDAEGRQAQAAVSLTVNCVNDPPHSITLTGQTVLQGAPVNTLVGYLGAEDPDADDTLTFTLPAGVLDNDAFSIVANELRTAAVLDYGDVAGYDIFVRVTDDAGAYVEESFTITIIKVNQAPTDIALSSTTVPENADAGTVVGTFTTEDPDDGDTFTYTLVAGAGDDDNDSFTVDGDELRTAAVFDYETRSEYSVRVRTEDTGGAGLEKAFGITVTDVNEAPVIVGTIADQTITQDETFAAIDLNSLASDEDAGDVITWSASGHTDLTVTIAGGQATISAPAGWDGAETITFTATDTGNLTASTSAEFRVLARFTTTLHPGFNLVSFPIEPLSTDIADVLASVAGHFSSVYWWDSTAGPGENWKAYLSQGVGSTLRSLGRNQGFWINITTTEPVAFTIDGTAEGTTSTAMYAATGGWNLVGYPSGRPADLPDALLNGSAGAECTLVYAYRAGDEEDPWKVYDPDAPAWANDLTAMSPGWGYWVKTGSDWTWEVTYEYELS